MDLQQCVAKDFMLKPNDVLFAISEGSLKKRMLCILWNWKGTAYYELFPQNQIKFTHLLFPTRRIRRRIDKRRPELTNRVGRPFPSELAPDLTSLCKTISN